MALPVNQIMCMPYHVLFPCTVYVMWHKLIFVWQVLPTKTINTVNILFQSLLLFTFSIHISTNCRQTYHILCYTKNYLYDFVNLLASIVSDIRFSDDNTHTSKCIIFCLDQILQQFYGFFFFFFEWENFIRFYTFAS